MPLPPYPPRPKPIPASELTAATNTPVVSVAAETSTMLETSAAMRALAAPTTIQEARGQGFKEGSILQAPLAPAKGPITIVPDVVPEKTTTSADGTKTTTPAQEPLVVVAVKTFWQSATVRALRNAVATAISLAIGIVVAQVVSVNGNLSEVNWETTQKAAIAAVAFSLASAYGAWLKRSDNNAIQK